MSRGGPGRACPLAYGYGAAALAREVEIEVDTLWVAGGLYGNPYALEALLECYAREAGAKALVFNGDFHWFDVDADSFDRVNRAVLQFDAIRGNVETELASPAADAGCGCGYPDWVDDGTVERSNRILERLRATARRFPQAMQGLARLPMHRVAAVGGERVVVVHGDADSLAGWKFSQERLADAEGRVAAARSFDEANAAIFASSHTCLPVLQRFSHGRLIVNNGAAGMPNFRGDTRGVATRISVSRGKSSLYSASRGSVFVEAVSLDYDAAAWQKSFLAQWPAGSDAHRSYFERIVGGPAYAVGQAMRDEAAVAA